MSALTQNENLASDVILSCNGLPVLRVSTAIVNLPNPAACGPGTYPQVETWIFSDLKDFRSRQRIHNTHGRREHALKFHARIVRILRRKFKELIEHGSQ